MPFDALQQIRHVTIGKSILRTLNSTTVAEQGVRLVEEENRPVAVGHIKHAIHVLFRFTNMLADDRGKIHAGQMELQFFGQDLRRFRRRSGVAPDSTITAPDGSRACSAFARRTGVFFFTWGVRVFRRITGAVAISQIPFRFIRDCPSGTTTACRRDG